ncbi:aldehyde dehydrogenase family protein [Flavobacterium sp.]|uniref:aldehyde dehydrogenase family protein n=1 Tax=Flavobacterium sp. TaxID=239 RepID=UPI00261628BE|nr:aldehyde dehydrogenase family protein [Flavobacterium sp.]MDD3005377.1 aldehyde dehydrogenase family protein [Flavobacterium sp.]
MDSSFLIRQRKKKLIQLLHRIDLYESKIIDALYKDFKKPPFESFLTEINIVKDDLKFTIKNIEKWSKPQRVLPSLLNFPSSDYIYHQPYGKVLIISPWNYPFLLALSPVISAFAAGNQVTLKPSELTPNTSSLLSKIIRETFDVNEVVAILGDAEMAKSLLDKKWDYIFFTGSVTVGKKVYQAAAKNLTPITLELGGKNPCIVDETGDLQLKARRIVWGKFLNAGQTCIAPDFLIIKSRIKKKFIELLIEEIQRAYSYNPESSPDFCRIINKNNWLRLQKLLENQPVIYGGKHNEIDFYLSPTLVDEPHLNSELMKEEIFGPILPLISYDNFQDLDKIISPLSKSLSLYVFTENGSFREKCIKHFSYGGGCINDTIVHFGNKRLPFGGIGNSGIGAYRGKKSFYTFTHQKSIVKRKNWIDINLRYAPYKNKLKFVKKILRWI